MSHPCCIGMFFQQEVRLDKNIIIDTWNKTALRVGSPPPLPHPSMPPPPVSLLASQTFMVKIMQNKCRSLLFISKHVILPKLSWHDLEGWKCFSHDLNSAGIVCLTVSAFLNSILLILRADIDTIYLRSESFKLIIDSKQLADAFFYIRKLHTNWEDFNRMHDVKKGWKVFRSNVC